MLVEVNTVLALELISRECFPSKGIDRSGIIMVILVFICERINTEYSECSLAFQS